MFASFSPDGKRIATASYDRTGRIWDAESGAPLMILGGHDGEVSHIRYSPDGRHVVDASFDMTARIWDVSLPVAPAQVAVPAAPAAPGLSASPVPAAPTASTAPGK